MFVRYTTGPQLWEPLLGMEVDSFRIIKLSHLTQAQYPYHQNYTSS